MIRQVLLSAKVDQDNPDTAFRQLKKLRYPVQVSPKLDGIRCHVEKSNLIELPVVLSRKNKAIPNNYIRETLASLDFLHMDGELIVGKANTRDCYNRCQSGVMSQGGEPDFRFFVFDNTDEAEATTPFSARLEFLQKKFRMLNNPKVVLLHHKWVYDIDELLAFETAMVIKGYEGLMIRDPHGVYKQGRSTLTESILIKVKRFVDGEAEILGCYEQETNLNEAVINEVGRSKRSSHKENKIPNGHLGGLHVRDLETGVEFDIGTMDGITRIQRKTLWEGLQSDPDMLLGKKVKYKHFPIGQKDKPRHPILCGFRDDIDIGENDANSQRQSH